MKDWNVKGFNWWSFLNAAYITAIALVVSSDIDVKQAEYTLTWFEAVVGLSLITLVPSFLSYMSGWYSGEKSVKEKVQ